MTVPGDGPGLTIIEACAWLDPQISVKTLHGLVTLLEIGHVGTRRRAGKGRPAYVYDLAELMALHAAVCPWLHP